MGFGVDASQNYKVWGNVEPIQYTSVAGHNLRDKGRDTVQGRDIDEVGLRRGGYILGSSSAVERFRDETFSIDIAKPRAINFKEMMASGGVYTSKDRVWLIPAAMIDAANQQDTDEFGNPREIPFSQYPFSPKPADRITDEDGTVWTILEAPLNTLKSTWRCVTRNMIVAYDLRDTLTVKRPTLATDDAGGRDYSTFKEVFGCIGVACRFQEQTAETVDANGQRATQKNYTVIVARRLYLTIEDIVVDQSDNIYEIKGWHDADQIGSLMQLECERRW